MNNQFKFCLLLQILLVILLKQISASNYTLPSEVIEIMAKREIRYHHFLWHNLRNLWNMLDKKTQEQIRELGWEPPRPALRYDHFGNSYGIEDNESGEDFFYMHREMIALVNQIMENISPTTQVEGFNSIPSPDDENFPALPVYTMPGDQNNNLNQAIAFFKNYGFYWNYIKPSEDAFTNQDYLRNLTLGQLGSQIEFSIHNWMHLRFSEDITEFRPDSSQIMPYVDEKWDDPKYNWLIDSYSSHVNPLFWKIHGWVDQRIEDWKKANNLEVIEWKGTWLGGPMSNIQELLDSDSKNLSSNDHEGMHRRMKADSHMNAMEEVLKLLLQTGHCTYLYCDHKKICS